MSKPLEFEDEFAVSEEAPREIHLAQYWAVLVKHRRLIALSIFLALAAAALLSLLAEPTYRATVVLAAEKERRTPLDSQWTPQVYGGFDEEFVPTQMRLMKSREVADRVVRKLNLVENKDLRPKRSGLFQRGDAEKPGQLARDAVTGTATLLQSHTEVAPIRGTNLIELSYTARTPKLAADIANALAEAYVATNVEAKFRIVGEASEFLGSQITQLKGEIDAKEQELLAYGRQKDIVSMGESNVTLQKLESLNRDYAMAVADRVAKEARYHELRTARPEATADTLSNGLVSQLRNEQLNLEREYAEKLNLFKPEWPAMQQLKARIDKARGDLDSVIQDTLAKAREAARSEYQTALRREGSLTGVLQSQKSEAQTLNTNAVEYTSIQVEIQNKRALLDTLLKRQAETEMLSRLSGDRVSNVRIVDRALPPRGRFSPSYKKNGLTGLAAGTLFGVGLAFFLSYLDRSLRTLEQVEQYLHLPALGVIPAVDTVGKRSKYGYNLIARKNVPAEAPEAIELLPHEHPRSRVAEAYRAFRTALLLSRPGGVKSLVVTSSFSREGKTVTAVNLAIVLGQLGKRVLLVDADLHRPRIHEIVRVSNRAGLVSILAENLEPAQAIVKTGLPGVSVVPAGPASPNPSGLLASEGMTRFLELAAMNFDHVVLDAPPVQAVADAILLGDKCDGVVLCVKGGETPRDQVTRSRDKLLRSNVRILGVLITNLTEQPGDNAGKTAYDYGYYGEREEPAADQVGSDASKRKELRL